VRNLRTAWDLVRAADRPNGGLVFDTWHFFRGEPQFDVLAGIPGDRVFCVQLDDAPAVPRGSLREETSRRLLPGDGALDLPAAIRALHRIGALRWVGPEVISPELAAMPVADAAALAMNRTRAVVDAALAGT
jgi:sugar phosphate isomerase/epimerase